MTLIGEAELEIRAVGPQFTADVNRVVQPGMAKVGTLMESTAGRGRVAFGSMWGAFAASSQGALGPVAGVISQAQMAASALERNSTLFAKGMVAGVTGAGIGIGLQSLGSGELAAQGQLRTSIENLGLVYEDYSSQVDKTIKTGEHYGHIAQDTLGVLNQLTIATKSPTKALADYMIVLNMAAVRHIPITTAARMLGMVYAGNSRALRQYGINLTDQTKALAKATAADKAHATAEAALAKAKQKLSDVEAELGATHGKTTDKAARLASAEARVASATAAVDVAAFKHGQASPQYAAAAERLTAAEANLTKVRTDQNTTTGMTVAQSIRLRDAEQKVKDAQATLTASTKDMTVAHKDAAGAAGSADAAIGELASRITGQADPAANTFSGHLHAFFATADDDAARFGQKYGPVITAVSTGLLAVSSGLQIGASLFGRFSAGGRAAAAMSNTLAAAQETQAAAAVSSTEATLALSAAETTLGEVDVALAGESTTAAAGIAAEGAAAATAATELGALDAAGGAGILGKFGAGAGAVGIGGAIALTGGTVTDKLGHKNPLSGQYGFTAADSKLLQQMTVAARTKALQEYVATVGFGLHPDQQKLQAWEALIRGTGGPMTGQSGVPGSGEHAIDAHGWVSNNTHAMLTLASNQSLTNARLLQILQTLRDHPAQIAGKLHSGSAVQQRFMQPELQ